MVKGRWLFVLFVLCVPVVVETSRSTTVKRVGQTRGGSKLLKLPDLEPGEMATIELVYEGMGRMVVERVETEEEVDEEENAREKGKELGVKEEGKTMTKVRTRDGEEGVRNNNRETVWAMVELVYKRARTYVQRPDPYLIVGRNETIPNTVTEVNVVPPLSRKNQKKPLYRPTERQAVLRAQIRTSCPSLKNGTSSSMFTEKNFGGVVRITMEFFFCL